MQYIWCMMAQALNVRHCQAPSRVSLRWMDSHVMHSAAADDSSSLLHRQSVSGSLEHRDNFLFLYAIPLSTHLQKQIALHTQSRFKHLLKTANSKVPRHGKTVLLPRA